MSAYDDAVAYLDAEVHPRCDYDIYNDMRDIVDEMEAENAKLRSLAYKAWKAAEQLCLAFEGPCSGDNGLHDPCPMGERDGECIYGQLRDEMRELGIEVD